MVEDVLHILTVRRAHRALEAHAVHRLLERLRLSVLQVITAREDDSVVFWQLNAGEPDCIKALNRARQAVEDQIAPLLFPIRQYLEQDQATEPGVFDLCIVEGLGLVQHRLAVDA